MKGEDRAPMIRIQNLVTGYQGREILKVEELSLAAGARTVFIGQNGSGKSTCLRAILGMLRYQGRILIDGKETRDYTARERAKLVAYLPQQLSAPDMDVQTLVAHGRYAHQQITGYLRSADREAMEAAMERTDVAHLRDRRLRALSGGERQRAYLAMVIAQDARMLLLDEPCASLDVSHQLRILEILQGLAREGRGIVMTSHDLPQSLSFADRICLLHEGALLYSGDPETLALDQEESKNLISKAFGIGVRRLDATDLLYHYGLCHNPDQAPTL